MRNHTAATLLAALMSLVACALTYVVLVGTYRGQLVDQSVMKAVGEVTGNYHASPGLFGQIQLPLLAALGAVLVIGALAQRSAPVAAYAGLTVVGSVVTAVLLKAALPRPDFEVADLHNSFPSNTVAAFTATAIALCVALPRRVLPLTAVVGVVGVAVVGFTVMSLQWHRPSDVIGGVLVAIGVAAVVELVVPVWRPHQIAATHVPNWPHSRSARNAR